MKRLIPVVPVLCALTSALAGAGSAHGQNLVKYRDAAKKERPVVELNGSIESESAAGLKVRGTTQQRTIAAADVIDVLYTEGLKTDLKQAWNRAATVETTAAKLPFGSKPRREALQDALARYRELESHVSTPSAIRHVRFKIGML